MDSGLLVSLSIINCVIFSFQEKTVLNKLKFRLNVPTPYVFMIRFLKAAQSDKKVCI